MSNLIVNNKKEIQAALNEILENNVSVDGFQDIAAKSLEVNEFDKVNRLLLDYYNKKVGYDFQNSLKQQLKLMVNEKVLAKLNNSDDLQKAKEKEIKDIESEENVDKSTLEKASKKLEDKKEKEEKNKDYKEEYDFKAELMKQVYIEEFKKYAELLYKLKERQAYDRNLTIGDKQGTELVLFEKYLMNLEASYKGYANSKNLTDKNLNDYKEIKEIKEKLAYDLGKKEEYIDNKVNVRMNTFKEMYQKRQEIAKKISEITDNKMLQNNPEKFKKEMDYYQEEYRKITYEIRVLDPTLEEYQEMIRVEQENKDFAKRELGINSQVGFSTGYSDNQKEIDESMVKKSIESKSINMEYKDNTIVKNTVDDLIREASTRINQNIRYDEVEEYLQQAEDMLSINENENKEATKKQNKISNEKLDKYMDKKVSGKTDEEIRKEEKNAKNPSNYESPFTVRNECNDTKVEENDLNKKLELKERLRKIQEKRNQIFGKQKDEENIEMIRK